MGASSFLFCYSCAARSRAFCSKESHIWILFKRDFFFVLFFIYLYLFVVVVFLVPFWRELKEENINIKKNRRTEQKLSALFCHFIFPMPQTIRPHLFISGIFNFNCQFFFISVGRFFGLWFIYFVVYWKNISVYLNRERLEVCLRLISIEYMLNIEEY